MSLDGFIAAPDEVEDEEQEELAEALSETTV